MKIGLLDVDGHNFPNLALMKISTYHKLQGNNVEFVQKGIDYNLLYRSKVFTFTPDIDIEQYSYKTLISGGTGYNLDSLPPEIDNLCPDYSLYPQYPHAYGFLTRGCPNHCSWCIVPKKEGGVRKYSDIEHFLVGRNSAILMDNNVLSCDWGIKQIEKTIRLGIKVDFNQGLDARIIAGDPEIARLLSRVKWLKPLRMACDTDSQMAYVEKATDLLRGFGCTPKQYFVYVLSKDIESTMKRVEFLRKLRLDPFVQPFIDFSGNEEYLKSNKYKRLKQYARYVNCRRLRNVAWDEYKYGKNYKKYES